jgi:hypothetical protein
VNPLERRSPTLQRSTRRRRGGPHLWTLRRPRSSGTHNSRRNDGRPQGLHRTDLVAFEVMCPVGGCDEFKENVIRPLVTEVPLVMGLLLLKSEMWFDDELLPLGHLHTFLLWVVFIWTRSMTGSVGVRIPGVLGHSTSTDHLHVVLHAPPRSTTCCRISNAANRSRTETPRAVGSMARCAETGPRAGSGGELSRI